MFAPGPDSAIHNDPGKMRKPSWRAVKNGMRPAA